MTLAFCAPREAVDICKLAAMAQAVS